MTLDHITEEEFLKEIYVGCEKTGKRLKSEIEFYTARKEFHILREHYLPVTAAYLDTMDHIYHDDSSED